MLYSEARLSLDEDELPEFFETDALGLDKRVLHEIAVIVFFTKIATAIHTIRLVTRVSGVSVLWEQILEDLEGMIFPPNPVEGAYLVGYVNTLIPLTIELNHRRH